MSRLLHKLEMDHEKTIPHQTEETTSSKTEAEAGDEYEDMLPLMAEKMEVEDFVSELCKGFKLLADPDRDLITPHSLRLNSGILGIQGMSLDDAEAMVREGDIDGDGALNQTEFCILMVRLSPGMMDDAEAWLEKAISQELNHFPLS
ncbi:PREDICTED: calcium-binding protein KIC [Tarenaya hassleriana]|uniref:calcium-binding protein KIC n=1 Tax=Tarenaya hassleriana TaxID=28532 RepID=UPI00053CA125|nr:PREDICTED: calcium-binding protein KIC [Tarenaya hassleriana]